MRKYFSFLILTICMMLASCGKDDPTGSVDLAIYDTFLPASIVVDRSDSSMIEACKYFDQQKLVVNSKNELPDDPFGSEETFSSINFSTQTLLISYYVHTFDLLSCNNMVIRNYDENTYDWTISMGIKGNAVDSYDQLIFTRFAILMPKLNKKADLKVYYGISNYGWN